MDMSNWSTSSILLAGAAGGGGFVGLAYAFPRRTRGILVRGVIVTALCYVYFAVRAHAGPTLIAGEVGGVAIYGALALRGLRGSVWWIAVAWALHPIWDVAVQLVGPAREFAPTVFATACLTWDPVVAIVIAAAALAQSRRHLNRDPASAARAG